MTKFLKTYHFPGPRSSVGDTQGFLLPQVPVDPLPDLHSLQLGSSSHLTPWEVWILLLVTLFLPKHPISLNPKPLFSVHPRALLLIWPEHKGSNKLSACYPGLPRILSHYTLTCSHLISAYYYYYDFLTPFLSGKLLTKSDVQANPLNK